MNVDNKGEGHYNYRIPDENIDFELTRQISGLSTCLYVGKLWFRIPNKNIKKVTNMADLINNYTGL